MNQTNFFEINSNNQKRNYWCCIIQLLSLLLDDDNIKNSVIKILFYIIVKLFSKTIDFQLEKDFISRIINLLFEIFKSKLDIVLYPEISFLLNNNELINDIFFKSENNKKLFTKIEKLIFPYIEKRYSETFDLNKMKNFEIKYEFVPLFYKLFIDTEKTNLDNSDTIKFYIAFNLAKTNNSLEYLFYKIFIYFNNLLKLEDYKVINLGFKSFELSEINIIENYIKKILKDNNFLNLVKNIVKSKVMEEAYSKINEEDKKNKNEYFIKDYDILNYYNNFCANIDKYLKIENFILMRLSRDIKAFTFRFLKIVINIEDVEFKNGNNEEDKEILLKAYLMFLLIHEFNHLIKL